MRPIKLVMTGFESYRDKTTIDFEELGTKGLYLITGDTGAGKTTIFDAITYVLYGSPSGTDRSVDMLRSHFADETIPTEVELDFETNGKKYHIKRNPDYIRKAKRGEGTAPEPASASLEFLSENHEPITGVQKVNAEIESILNLKKEQFCRIAMIAQGSFQKLLLAKKDEKQNLFRELFHTEKYQNLQEALKFDKKQLGDSLSQLKLRLRDALNRIEVTEFDENSTEINRIKSLPNLMEEDILRLNEFVSKDEKLLNEIISQISEVEKKLESINTELQIGQTRIQIKEQIDSIENKLATKNQEIETLKETLTRVEEEAKKSPELEKQKTLLEASLKDYEEIAKEEAKLKELNLQIKIDEKNLDSLNKNNKELSDKLEKLKAELLPLKNVGEKIGTLEAESQKNYEVQNDLEEIHTQLSKLVKDKELLAQAQIHAKKAISESDDANNSYSEKLRLFNLEQAGILAEGLKEGTACPVCGSKEHPHLAVKSAKAPSQSEIEEAKESAESLQKIASEASLKAGQQKTAVESAEENIEKQLKKNFENLSINDEQLSSKIEQKKSQLKNEAEKINNNLQQEKKAKARREEIENEIPDLETKIKTAADESNQLQIKISGNKASLQSDSNALKEKKSKLQYETYAEAKQELAVLSNKINELKSNVEKSKDNLDSCEKEVATLNGNAESLKKQLSKTKEVDIEKLAAEKTDYSDKKNALNEQRDSLNERKGKNLESVKSIEKLVPEIKKTDERYSMVSSMYEVATGSNRGNTGKPSLEVYVQMQCLDQINRRANQRLRKMTENKYELRRRIEEDGSELGLDLSIKDFYTGRERDVQSLSGGEQFQASLSLALGLADEIQESSGGIKLDTMFIDEGFGTLDPETLNKAMKALEDLSQGNKLIGIISHVADLESRIPKKILVKKDESGISHVTLETC